MTVFRFRITDENPAHIRADLYCGPDPDHLALAGRLTFRRDEWPAFADAITGWNERQESCEWGVQWHGADVVRCLTGGVGLHDEHSARTTAKQYANAEAVRRRPAGPWTRTDQEAETAR